MINGSAMKENVVKTKSFAFAARVVILTQFLCEQVGAMVREAELCWTKQ